MHLFDSHSKDENGNLSSSGTAVLLKFNVLTAKLYKISYYNTFPLNFYFQVQFIQVHCTANAKNAIKYELRKEAIVSKTGERFPGQKNSDNPEKKKTSS